MSWIKNIFLYPRKGYVLSFAEISLHYFPVEKFHAYKKIFYNADVFNIAFINNQQIELTYYYSLVLLILIEYRFREISLFCR